MIILINDRHRIASDQYAWSIQKPVRRKGKISWESFRWYATAEQAVNGLVELMVRLSDAETLIEAIQDVNRICSELSSALTPEFAVRRVSKGDG